VGFLWTQLREALPLIWGGHRDTLRLGWVTIRLALVATGIAAGLGIPLGCVIGLGRFRGRRVLHALANASLAVPSVIVGVLVLILLLPGGVLGGLRIAFTLKGVYIAQTLLALPYTVALTAAAVNALPPGLLDQARALGAGRAQLAALALREARIGVMAAVIAALGTALSEVGAVVIVGGNIQNHDQTLASAVLQQTTDYTDYPDAIAIAIVLLVLIGILMAALTVLGQRADGGLRLRLRTR
jgi:tungstate transport system permease protein